MKEEFIKTGLLKIPEKFTRKKIKDICSTFGNLMPCDLFDESPYQPKKTENEIHYVGYNKDFPWGAELYWHQDGIYYDTNYWGRCLYPLKNSNMIDTYFSNLQLAWDSICNTDKEEARTLELEYIEPAKKFDNNYAGKFKSNFWKSNYTSKSKYKTKKQRLVVRHPITQKETILLCPLGLYDESFTDTSLYKVMFNAAMNYVEKIEWKDNSMLLINDNLTWMHMTKPNPKYFNPMESRTMIRLGFNYANLL